MLHNTIAPKGSRIPSGLGDPDHTTVVRVRASCCPATVEAFTGIWGTCLGAQQRIGEQLVTTSLVQVTNR
jgi:hypothetical protein